MLRRTIAALDPDLPLSNVRTMDDFLAVQRWPSRVFGTMFAIFAVIALVLAAVGLYAVTAYSVTQRTQELGIRMALGASPAHIRWLILQRGVAQIAMGLTLGWRARSASAVYCRPACCCKPAPPIPSRWSSSSACW